MVLILKSLYITCSQKTIMVHILCFLIKWMLVLSIPSENPILTSTFHVNLVWRGFKPHEKPLAWWMILLCLLLNISCVFKTNSTLSVHISTAVTYWRESETCLFKTCSTGQTSLRIKGQKKLYCSQNQSSKLLQKIVRCPDTCGARFYQYQFWSEGLGLFVIW